MFGLKLCLLYSQHKTTTMFSLFSKNSEMKINLKM